MEDSEEKKLKQELKKEILHGWHRRFAETQKAREQSFLKILGFLGAVIFGYAYVYHDATNTEYQELSFIAITCEIILTFGSLIIITIAYNYRRDQYICAKIERKAGLFDETNIFPEGYDPAELFKDKKPILKWIPDFLVVFYLIFPIMQIILLISYCQKVKCSFDICNIDWGITLTFVLSVLTLISTILANYCYYRKLKEKLTGKD